MEINRVDVKIVQICSDLQDTREIASYNSLTQLGYRYIRIINPRYTEVPPKENVFDGREDWIVGKTKEPGTWGFTSGHYGAWQGHLSAILSSFVDKDYSLICECDCLLNVDPKEFRSRVDEAISLLENSDYKIVRFEAPNWQVEYKEEDRVSENLYLGSMMTLGHCYMIHSKHRDFYIKCLDTIGWHTPDWWLNFSFERSGEKMPAFKDLILTKQSEGFSLIDNVYHGERVH